MLQKLVHELAEYETVKASMNNLQNELENTHGALVQHQVHEKLARLQNHLFVIIIVHEHVHQCSVPDNCH